MEFAHADSGSAGAAKDAAAQQLQQEYYERTAAAYEDMHVQPGDEHSIALEYIAQLSRVVDAGSVLDVGAGTGRGLRYLANLRPELRVAGIEPVAGLRSEAQRLGTPLSDGAGQAIPFEDDSFDLVIATGVLHHVPQPELVVREMLRVARCGVMISDSNRFGQGHAAVRAAKMVLYTTGAWNLYNRLRTGGRGYMESDGDGVFYSYSIFDSMPAVSEWADRTFVIPTGGRARGRFGSLVDASHGLLVALRESSSSSPPAE
jgi:ubiquinone/menaquinone biosynthesis C-methylase UbiE